MAHDQVATQLYVLRWSYGRSGPSLRVESESGTKESVCIRKKLNFQRTGLGNQHGGRFIFWDTNMAAVTSGEITLYRKTFGVDTKRYPGWHERQRKRQRHRTGTSPSHTSNIVPERLAERVWRPKS